MFVDLKLLFLSFFVFQYLNESLVGLDQDVIYCLLRIDKCFLTRIRMSEVFDHIRTW